LRSLRIADLCLLCQCTGPVDANKDGIADGVRTPSSVTQVAPSSPIGSVSGIVANTKFFGLDGVTVTLVLGGKSEDGSSKVFSTVTAADGTYSFQKVPAGGSGILTATKAGFGLARTSIFVPAASGTIPINDANGSADSLLLTELNTIEKFVVLAATGRPAKGAKAVLEVTPAATRSDGQAGYGTGVGVTPVEAVVDDAGLLQFGGVPAPLANDLKPSDSINVVFTHPIIDATSVSGDFNGTLSAIGP
jgi:hypothetical protein